MQQFIVGAYLKIEANRISYFVHNQDLLRTEEYYGLVDYLHNRAERDNVPFGRMIILPSTFEMSSRNQMQRFQDAMAVVSEMGCPSFFITMTCNPKWPEIVENLLDGQEAINHPLLVARIFKMKLDDLIVDLTERHVMGVCISFLYVIEFQKRGLPHAHILITLRNEDKPLDPFRIDQLVCAELPDSEIEPELYLLVGKHMVHGPCGQHDPTEVCMVNGECIKKFPKYWFNNTTIRNGRVYYRRRRLNGRTIQIRRNNHHYVVDSRFVVPYNPYLLLKYRTHINIEACTSTGTVKYLYKYFFKGPDQGVFRIVENRNAENDGGEQLEMRYDEIRSYLNGRYMTPPEASWRILKFPMHTNSHHVYRLAIHLPGRQRVVFRRGEEQAVVNRGPVNTELTGWFELNRDNPQARQFLYREIPYHFVWNKSHKRWTPRQRLMGKIISRMYNVSVRNGELYYLRVLLLRVRGATSFESLRIVNGVVCDSFQEACRQLNLLAEDREWIRCLTEASEKDMPKQMRQMFAYILLFCQVDDPVQLWNDFKRFMMEDFTRRDRMEEREAEIRALQKIQFILMINGRRLSQFGLEDPPEFRPNLVEDDIDQVREREIGETMLERLNVDQRNVFDVVMRAIENNNEARRYFFVSGAAGTGKTFLYNTLITVLNGRGEKVVAIAWTGIAAALLKHGRTVHNRFKLPVPIVENSTSMLTARCEETRFIREAKLIIWDEITTTTRNAFELVDRTLKDICQNDRPFGGKCVILGGDFKQCLPVVPDGDRATIVAHCIKSSILWRLFENIQLNINMRVRPDEIAAC
ncbi:uncharacterized protein LOC123015966 [Tribolium madens]|uniref:uncharacterized protein LOC123015966 n=1 Tax=Tribolium madens TaxID=41895 RepID=UPI001CF75805|nr:uncharacterized protein LOC123015966 [Tribolium madens]